MQSALTPLKLHISFWPSADESRGSMQFHRSLDDVKNRLRNNQIDFQVWRDITTEQGETVRRGAPPPIAEIILYLGTSGIAVAVYELLRLWIEAKNGRKIRVKMGDFEVETTQMSEKQFRKLFEILNQQRKSDEREKQRESLRQKLGAEGFILIDAKQSEEEEFKLY